MMKKTLKQRLVSGLLTTVFAASLLPMSAFATGTSPEYAAQVGETKYATLLEAVAEAAKLTEANQKIVVLLADVDAADVDKPDTDGKETTLELGDVALLVPADGKVNNTADKLITIEGITITGKRADFVVKNEGHLVLSNVTVTNGSTESGMAVYNAAEEALPARNTTAPEAAELTIISGSYSGVYAVGMKNGTVGLNQLRTAEKPDLAGVPVLEGTTADFFADVGGQIEVLTDLGEKTNYTVEAAVPGPVAHMGKDMNTVTPRGAWFVNTKIAGDKGLSAFDEENGIWTMAAVIPEDGVKLDATEFTYDGESHMPKVTVTVGGTELKAGTDYDVAVNPAETKEAGDYTITVTGKGNYSGTRTAAFTIKAAAPATTTVTVELQLPQGGYAYTGEALTPAVVVKDDKAAVISAENYDVAYANNTNAGTATVTVTAKETATVKFEKVEKTFEIKTAAVTPTVTVDAPAAGMTHTGSALTPAVTVKNGETVIPTSEYDVAYANNTNVGTATVTVTDKNGGNYSFEKVTAQFTIVAAEKDEPLLIADKKDAVTYGDAAFKLTTTGGKKNAAVNWAVSKGNATIDKDGLLTITGAGDVTVTAAQSDELKDEWTFTVAKKELTVSGVTASDKTYDGKNTVTITAVELAGIVNKDDVKVNTEGLTGELNAAGVGVYNAVKPGNMSLTGAAAANYKLTVSGEPVAAKVTVKKADLPAALESIEVKLPVSADKVEVPDLGAGMPKDAGTLSYLRNDQKTETGNKVVVFKWDVDDKGTLTSEIGAGVGGDKITYVVAVQSQNYNNALVNVVVTLGAEAVDTSKLTVTPASTSLTYNGADQKPAVTVKYDGAALKEGTDFDVTYSDDVKNVGDKEIKVTLKGKYTGTATAKYTINKAKITVSGGSVSDKTYDGSKSASVNLGTVSGIVKGEDVKVTAKGLFADANSGSGKKVSVTYTLSGNAAGNYELATTSATLTGRIYSISANSLYSRLGSLTTANANSSKAQTLKDVIYLSNLALGDGGMASGERSSITALRDDAENMQDRVEAAAAAANTESIRTTAKVTKDNVKLSDQAALTKAQADLNTALTTYSGNYTAGEKKEIETDKTRVADALAVVTRVDSANKLITALPTDFTTVTTQTADAVNAANTAYSGLSDYGKSLIDKAQLEKLTAATKATEGVTPTQVPEDGVTNITGIDKNEGDKESPETIKFPTWIILIAVVLAAAAGGGYFWYYKKQQEEEEYYY